MPKPTLSPEQQAIYTAEYLETLDRIDALKEELKEEVKERKGEIASLDKAAFRLRRLLAGKTEDQTEIPGSEIPSVAPRKGLTSITLRTGEREVTATPEQLRAGLDELKRRKGRR